MEIVEEKNEKPKSKIQNIFLTRLKEFIQSSSPHRIEKNETIGKPSLLTVTSLGVIFTIVFSMSAVKVGIVNALFILLFIISVVIICFKTFSN